MSAIITSLLLITPPLHLTALEISLEEEASTDYQEVAQISEVRAPWHFDIYGDICDLENCEHLSFAETMHGDYQESSLDEGAPTGTLSLQINTNINTPEGFTNQDIYVAVYCPDYDPYNDNYGNAPYISVGLYNMVLTFDDFYRGTLELPVGEYTFLGGGANNVSNAYAMQLFLPSDSFVISENQRFSTDLCFFDNNVNALLHVIEKNEGNVRFSFEQDAPNQIVALTLVDEQNEEHIINLYDKNFWKDDTYLPIGIYSVTSIDFNQDREVNINISDFEVIQGGYVSVVVSLLEEDATTEEETKESNNTWILSLIAVAITLIFIALAIYTYKLYKEEPKESADVESSTEQ